MFAYRDTWKKSNFQIREIPRVGTRRQLRRAGGGMPPEDWGLAPLPECLLHGFLLLLFLLSPPRWQLQRGGMKEVRWEA